MPDSPEHTVITFSRRDDWWCCRGTGRRLSVLLMSHLKDSSDDKDVVPGERKLEGAAVQTVPQLPDGPSPRWTPEDPPGPRALRVEER